MAFVGIGADDHSILGFIGFRYLFDHFSYLVFPLGCRPNRTSGQKEGEGFGDPDKPRGVVAPWTSEVLFQTYTDYFIRITQHFKASHSYFLVQF